MALDHPWIRRTGAAVIAGLLGALLAPLPLPALSPDPRIEQAQTLLDQGQAEPALALLKPVLRKQPNHAQALFLRSTARIMTGDVEGARSDLEATVRADPSLRQAWVHRAALELDAWFSAPGAAADDPRLSAALEGFRQAARLDPSAPDNHLNQGAVLVLRGDLEEASQHFERHLDLNGRSPESRFQVARNYALGGYAGPAVEQLRSAIAVDEKIRLRARTDPNFAALATHPTFQTLLATDSYVPPAGSFVRTEAFAAPYEAGHGQLLPAVLDALQLSGILFDGRVEVTPEWALIWADTRIRISSGTDGRGEVTFTAPPGSMAPAVWETRTDRLVALIAARAESVRAR